MKNPSQKMTKPSQNFGLHFLPFFLQFTHCPDRNVQSCVFLNPSRKMLQPPDLPLPPPPLPLSLLSIRHAPCLSCAFSFFKPEPSSFLTLIPVVSSSQNEAIPFRISKAPVLLCRSTQTRGVHEDLTTFELASSKPKRSTRINPLSQWWRTAVWPLVCKLFMRILHQLSSRLRNLRRILALTHCTRFLQGPEIDEAIVQKIRDAIREQREITIQLINYTKSGKLIHLVLL
ncbi:hypothetical protein Cgig2_024880 [Carnegiea gigantea]|uniref:Uncharacterized protein n=1 Tax=Carnegiea gigantea TaxID=171969 RepID=A0A9Q1GWH9_9CARY|nr:hypothetical protein Cgig2_024880 [Carnegiea gigantea]